MKAKRLKLFLVIILMIVGFSLIFSTFIFDIVNKYHSDYVIAQYETAVSDCVKERKKDKAQASLNDNSVEGYINSIINECDTYNSSLYGNPRRWKPTKEQSKVYQNLLNVGENGMMGYISIPKIELEVPIYHSSSKESMSKGVGHIEGSSLPVGGKGTHCVLAGHTGMLTQKMFTDISSLETGDNGIVNNVEIIVNQ